MISDSLYGNSGGSVPSGNAGHLCSEFFPIATATVTAATPCWEEPADDRIIPAEARADRTTAAASTATVFSDSLYGNLAVYVPSGNRGNLCSEVFPTATATGTTTAATIGEDGDMADQFCSTALLDKNGDDVIDKEAFLKAATREWSFMEDESSRRN